MHFKRSSVTTAALLAGAANSAAIAAGADAAIVYEHYIPAKYVSTVYQTSEVTVMSCPSTETNCPLSTGVLTSIIPVSTTICPATITSVTTSGTPVSGLAPPTVTVHGTETKTVTFNPSSVLEPTGAGFPTGSSATISAISGAGPATTGPASVTSTVAGSGEGSGTVSSASSPTGETAGAVTGSGQTAGGASSGGDTTTLQTTSTMHVTTTKIITVPAASSVFSFAPSGAITSASSNVVGSLSTGGIPAGTAGTLAPSAGNGTIATQSPSQPSIQPEPYQGSSQKLPFEMGVAALAAGVALFLV